MRLGKQAKTYVFGVCAHDSELSHVSELHHGYLFKLCECADIDVAREIAIALAHANEGFWDIMDEMV